MVVAVVVVSVVVAAVVVILGSSGRLMYRSDMYMYYVDLVCMSNICASYV